MSHEVTHCKLYKKVAFSHTGPKEAIFTRLRCKQWSCDYCARKNASIWRAFLKDKLPQVSDEWWLVTFTAHPNLRSQALSLKNLRENFDKMLKRVKRVFGRVEYVRTYEKHPTSQAIHMHVIMSSLAPFVALGCSVKLRPMAIGTTTRRGRHNIWSLRTWFKKTAQEITMGYICDARKLEGDIDRAVWYVTKYLTKALQAFYVKGLRHVQTSRSIGSPKNEKVSQWFTAAYIVPNNFAPNTAILDLNTGEIIDNSYWEVHSFYPYDD